MGDDCRRRRYTFAMKSWRSVLTRIGVGVVLGGAVSLQAQRYALGSDSRVQSGVPKGTVAKHVLAAGRFYPGTPHDYAVYVPAQYDRTKATPFMVFLDGSSYLGDGVRVPVVLDNLIAKHELPPMIAIFVDPGVLPAVTKGAQSRYERVYEYDSLNDRYSRFLLEELIPAVALEYNLSANPDDRGISGISTGAVGAFMAAWNRPDQFHRVLSFIGTYVGMKGADSLPALIRKTEPKPMRVFLQDGKADHIVAAEPYGTFFAGSWPINNQVMYEALEYSGYDAKLEMGSEGHNMKQGGAIMPDALRWLWRDYPRPVVVREPAQSKEPGWDEREKVYSTVWADKGWEPLGLGYSRVDGLTAGAKGEAFFSDSAASRIYKVDAEGKVTVFKEATNGATVLRGGPMGEVYAYQPGRRRIVSYGVGGEEKQVAKDIDVRDMAVTAAGIIYFSDAVHGTVGMVDVSGKVRTVYDGREIAAPSGVAISPDQAMVIVSDAQARFSWSFQIALDGTLVNGEPFFRLETLDEGWQSKVGGVTEDSIGQVYFATPLGVQVCEANGRMGEVLNSPVVGAVSHVVFAGEKMDWMLVAEGGRVFRRPVKVMGVAVGSTVELPKPPL